MSTEPLGAHAAVPRTGTLWLATGVAYADRLAAFVLPMLVLRTGAGQAAYAAVEFVISVSVLLATFFDAGLRNYVLFHARDAGKPSLTTQRTLQAFVPIAAAHWSLLLLAALPLAVGHAVGGEPAGLLVLGVLRGAALATLGLATQLLILHGRPMAGTLVSLASWAVGALSFALPADVDVVVRTAVFFSAAAILLVSAGVLLWRHTRLRPGPAGWSHLRAALAWGWPLLAAAAASMAVAHVSRMYAYARLPLADMVGFTFWLRVFSIIQLSHAALSAVLSPQIFAQRAGGLDLANTGRYLRFMAPPVLVALGLASGMALLDDGMLPAVPRLPLGAALAIGAYVVCWCAGAYLEIYLTRDSHTSMVLIASLLAAGLFLLLLLAVPPSTPLALALSMGAAATCYLMLLAWRLKEPS